MSGARRFFCGDIDYPARAEAELTGEEFAHAKTVLRIGEGDEIVLLDGNGGEYPAIVASVGKHSLTAHITGSTVGGREPSTPVRLLTGALKGDKTELVVQKATELGVSSIAVFSSKYCSAYINQNKLDRLNRVAREAAKQCLRSRAPSVEYFGDLKGALASASQFKNKLFACEFVHSSAVSLRDISGPTAIVIGSEGGFAEEELALAEDAGYSPISLGRRILRAETAAIAALSNVMFVLGELG